MSDSTFEGLSVLGLVAGSEAERAGVQKGDVVLIANGCRVSSFDEYIKARQVRSDRLELTVRRGDKILDLVLTLEHTQPDTLN